MPGAVEVASLFATLSLNDAMTRDLRTASRGIEGFGRQMRTAGRTISGIGAGMQQALSPVADFLSSGIDVAAAFEQSMAEIQARTGITGDEMERVRDVALQMGADTAFSAQQASDAFLQLLSSGQSLDEAMSTLPAVLSAAAAGGMDLGTMADGVTDVLSMFGLAVEDLTPDVQAAADALGITAEDLYDIAIEGDSGATALNQLADATGLTNEALLEMVKLEDAADVVESLSRAAGASSATMGDLMEGLSNVGPVAAQFGMDVNETIAALAVLAENGIKGAEGGTALKSMLLNMSQDTEAVAGAWNELGVSLYDAQGNARDMNTVLEELKTALESLPAEDQNRLMRALAGSYGIMALSALTGDKSIAGMESSMRDAASAAEVADARMSGWAGANDALQGSIETLQIQALTPLLENTLTPMVKQLTEVVNSITEWATENPELATTVAEVLIGLALLGVILVPLGIVISTVGTAVTALATGFGLVATGVATIAGPMLLAIGPILAVGAAVAAVIAQVNEFQRIVGEGAMAVRTAATDAGITDQELWDRIQTEAQAQWGPEVGYAIGAQMYYSTGARADGGPVSAGMPYVVGEKGPELLVPSSNGTIIPNHALGGQTLNVYVNAYGATPHEFAELVDRALRDRGR